MEAISESGLNEENFNEVAWAHAEQTDKPSASQIKTCSHRLTRKQGIHDNFLIFLNKP